MAKKTVYRRKYNYYDETGKRRCKTFSAPTKMALKALISIVSQAGSELVGCGIVIEKAYQPGGELIRSQGVRVESLARVKSMSVKNGIEFCE